MPTTPLPDPDASGDAVPPEAPASLRATYLAIAASGGVIAAVAALEGDGFSARSVLVGAAIAVVNLWVFAKIAHAILAASGASAPWAAVGVLKMAALFGGVWLLLRHHVVAPFSLAMGYMALPIGATLASVFASPAARRRGPSN